MLSIAPAIHLGAQCGPKIELATVKFGPYPGYGGPFSSVTWQGLPLLGRRWRLRLTGTIVALAGARAELKFRSENSNAFSHGDQKMSASEAPPEAGRRTPATQLQLSS